jgi:hypothetical protein
MIRRQAKERGGKKSGGRKSSPSVVVVAQGTWIFRLLLYTAPVASQACTTM